MKVKTALFFSATLAAAQDAIANGATALPPAAMPEEKGHWTWTTWIIHDHHHEDEEGHGDCGGGCCKPRCRRPTSTIYVVPSTITETRRATITTLETIPVPVPVPVPPCPCERKPDCWDNAWREDSCGCHRPSSTHSNRCSCGGGGGGNISTSQLPYTTPVPNTSVIVLSTKTASVTIFTVSSGLTSSAGKGASPNYVPLMIALCFLLAVL